MGQLNRPLQAAPGDAGPLDVSHADETSGLPVRAPQGIQPPASVGAPQEVEPSGLPIAGGPPAAVAPGFGAGGDDTSASAAPQSATTRQPGRSGIWGVDHSTTAPSGLPGPAPVGQSPESAGQSPESAGQSPESAGQSAESAGQSPEAAGRPTAPGGQWADETLPDGPQHNRPDVPSVPRWSDDPADSQHQQQDSQQ
jgi:hypothetical protein